MSYYVNQNADVFAMAVEHFGIRWGDIDCIDRTRRLVILFDGTELEMPQEWNMS